MTEKEVLELLERTKDPDAEVREKAIRKLGYLGYDLPQDLRSNVVLRLLNFCENNELQEVATYNLMRLSVHWDLGKAIPKVQQAEVAERILSLDSKGSLKVKIWVSVTKTTDNWAYPYKLSILPAFHQLMPIEAAEEARKRLMKLADSNPSEPGRNVDDPGVEWAKCLVKRLENDE
jgi:hypothetical protein